MEDTDVDVIWKGGWVHYPRAIAARTSWSHVVPVGLAARSYGAAEAGPALRKVLAYDAAHSRGWTTEATWTSVLLRLLEVEAEAQDVIEGGWQAAEVQRQQCAQAAALYVGKDAGKSVVGDAEMAHPSAQWQ